ncbi:head maturation protease, ClpP-related [Clostridium sp. Marseille-QA1073]
MKKYYSLVQKNNEADIYIYGDISSWQWSESDVSSYTLSKELDSLQDVDVINVYINSYGGEVAEGLAIYSALKRHKAKVKTYADGFACSIASVIFMAGDERIMSNASLLMIHNAWTTAAGNANDFRKQADELEKVTKASINAYMNIVNISEEKLKDLLDNEAWLLPQEALDMGFATSIIADSVSNKASQSVKKALINIIKQSEKGKPNQVVQETEEEQQQVEETQEEPKEQEKENKVLNLIAALYR